MVDLANKNIKTGYFKNYLKHKTNTVGREIESPRNRLLSKYKAEKKEITKWNGYQMRPCKTVTLRA